MLCPNCEISTLESGKKVSTCTNHQPPLKLTADDLGCPNCRRIDRDTFVCLGPVHHYFNQTNPCGEIQSGIEKGTVVWNHNENLWKRYQSITLPSYYKDEPFNAGRWLIEQVQAKAVILGYMLWKETIMGRAEDAGVPSDEQECHSV